MTPTIFKQTPRKDKEEEAETAKPAAERTDSGPAPAARAESAPTPRGQTSGAVSVLASGTTVTGDISLQGELQLEGRVEGSLRTKGRVVVGSNGVVEGEVEADEIVVAGRVKGSLKARKALRLKRACEVAADVEGPALEIEEGASLDGSVKMTGKVQGSGSS